MVDSIDTTLKNIALEKLGIICQRLIHMKETTESINNRMKKKQLTIDPKSLANVKYKMDREYEKVFLRTMADIGGKQTFDLFLN